MRWSGFNLKGLNRTAARPPAPDSPAAGVLPARRRSARKSRAPARSRQRAPACACLAGRREPAQSGNRRAPGQALRDQFRDRASNHAAGLALQSVAAKGVPLRYGLQPALGPRPEERQPPSALPSGSREQTRSEEHTSELQSRLHLVCRLLLEKKKT